MKIEIEFKSNRPAPDLLCIDNKINIEDFRGTTEENLFIDLLVKAIKQISKEMEER